MRRLLALLSVLALAVPWAASSAVANHEAVTAAECQQRWADIAQTHGENGNPGGSTTVLNERWERLDDRARRLARQAGREDCGERLWRFDRVWNGLESLQYALHEVDMPYLLAFAEGDRRHWKRLRHDLGLPEELPEDLKAAFRTARLEAPAAAADLTPVLAGAGDVNVADWRARRAFLRAVATVAEQSSHVTTCRAALDLIADAELDEE